MNNTDDKPKEQQALSPVNVLDRIRRHMAMMAPHQKEREAGKLLIAAENQIENLIDAGEQLSNIAFNWAQDSSRPEHERKMLNKCRIKWDAAMRPNDLKLRHDDRVASSKASRVPSSYPTRLASRVTSSNQNQI